MNAPQVDFYVIDSNNENSCIQLLAKLVSKAYADDKRIYIRAKDETQAAQIDELLWTFNDISFLPHAIIGTEAANDTPILIGTGEQCRDIVFNLHADIPAEFTMQRLIEIVYDDKDVKKQCRNHYKAYQDKDFPLKSHHLK